MSDQPYDVKVVLDMPRTPNNTAAGNFMLNLTLFAPLEAGTKKVQAQVLATESRPAILTFHSEVMDLIYKMVGLPLYVTGWRKELERLEVDVMERVEFGRGWKSIPATARLEIQSVEKLQIYSAGISFKARLRGLRYVVAQRRLRVQLTALGS